MSQGPYSKRTLWTMAITVVLLSSPLLAYGLVMVAGGRSGGWSLVWVALACLGVLAIFGPIAGRRGRM